MNQESTVRENSRIVPTLIANSTNRRVSLKIKTNPKQNQPTSLVNIYRSLSREIRKRTIPMASLTPPPSQSPWGTGMTSTASKATFNSHKFVKMEASLRENINYLFFEIFRATCTDCFKNN